MLKQDIRNLSFEELVNYLASWGENTFRAKQIFEWLYKRGVKDFTVMRNLPLSLRHRLEDDFSFSPAAIEEKLISSDETTKFLFDLYDHEKIETVLIPAAHRATVCVSTQAGCKFGCRFCASGIGGWLRDLTCSEILNQILTAKETSLKHPLTHVVFMGTGEPLDNYENLLKAIRILNHREGLNIAARRITISTCGVIPQIQRLSQEGLQIELAISLHGFNDESRRILMPVNKKYPMKELIEAVKEYIQATHRQVTFEYILIKDLTCSPKAACELGKLLKGMICKMNLIPYNKVSEFDHQPPTREEMYHFRDQLVTLGIHATIRTPRGREVDAACGQLRHTFAKKGKMAKKS